MIRFKESDRHLIVAIGLGLCTLLSNLLAQRFPEMALLRPGSIFIFLSASSLGLPGALASLATGVLPEIFFSSDYFYLVRMGTSALLIGLLSYSNPRLPFFGIPMALWLLIFGPLIVAFEHSGDINFSISAENAALAALSEIFQSILAGNLLLLPNIATFLNRTQRNSPTLTTLLVHSITLISSLALFAALILPLINPINALSLAAGWRPALTTAALMLIGIACPALLAIRLARVLHQEYAELIGGNMLVTHRAFSGRASDFWRRQSSPHELPTSLSGVIARDIGGSSSGNIPPLSSEQQIPADAGVCALSRNGTVSFVNRKFRIFTSISVNDVIGKSIESIGMDQQLVKHILLLVEQTFNQGPRNTELRVAQSDSQSRFFEISSRRSDAFENSSLNEGPDSVIIMIRDITDRRTVEAHLLQAQKVESLGTIVSGVAHSFNNSLTAVVGQASFARSSSDGAVMKRALDAIFKAATEAAALVRQLLDFSQNSPSLSSRQCLAELIELRLDLLRKSVGEGFSITFTNSAPQAFVECNVNLLMQAITNLVLNAREAYPSGGGEIAITLDTEEIDAAVADLHVGSRAGSFVRLRVKDFGIGMPPETLAKAFDPLFTTKRSSGHTGLGLSIVFAIVRNHDGFLTAESRPEKGTCVSIYLPLASATSIKEIEPTPPPEAIVPADQRRAVLVVEDDESVRTLVSMILEANSYDVRSCTNAEEALQLAAQASCDLALVDMVLPRGNGPDLIKQLRQINPLVKTLLMSGFAPNIEPGAMHSNLLHKPFDAEALLRAIEATFAGKTGQTFRGLA